METQRTTAEHETRTRYKTPSSTETVPAFYRMVDLVCITALSRATLYRRIAEKKFPSPVHLGGRACGWPASEVQAWINDPEGYAAASCVGLPRTR